MSPSLFSLYVVTDSRYLGVRSLLDVCAQAVQAGVRIVQLRDKQASTRDLVEQGKQVLGGNGVRCVREARTLRIED